jgi:hypothetical protein
MVEVMFTTAPLFASAIAAKSGSAWIGALAPCAACCAGADFPGIFACGSELLEQPAARMTAESKQTESILAFMDHLKSLD